MNPLCSTLFNVLLIASSWSVICRLSSSYFWRLCALSTGTDLWSCRPSFCAALLPLETEERGEISFCNFSTCCEFNVINSLDYFRSTIFLLSFCEGYPFSWSRGVAISLGDWQDLTWDDLSVTWFCRATWGSEEDRSLIFFRYSWPDSCLALYGLSTYNSRAYFVAGEVVRSTMVWGGTLGFGATTTLSRLFSPI